MASMYPTIDMNAPTAEVDVAIAIMVVCAWWFDIGRDKFFMFCTTGCTWAVVYSIPAFHANQTCVMYSLGLTCTLAAMEMALISTDSYVIGGTCVVATVIVRALENPSITAFIHSLPAKCTKAAGVSAATMAWDVVTSVLFLETTITITCSRVYLYGLTCAFVAVVLIFVYERRTVNAKLSTMTTRYDKLQDTMNMLHAPHPNRQDQPHVDAVII